MEHKSLRVWRRDPGEDAHLQNDLSREQLGLRLDRATEDSQRERVLSPAHLEA